MSTSYAMIPRYKFIPPNPLNESEFAVAKQLQYQGSKKVRYLSLYSKSKLKWYATFFGIAYGAICVFWFSVWVVSLSLPNSGAADMYNHDTFQTLAGYLSIGLIYVVYEVLWEYFTANGYNKKLHRMVNKSPTYSEFRNAYYLRYKK